MTENVTPTPPPPTTPPPTTPPPPTPPPTVPPPPGAQPPPAAPEGGLRIALYILSFVIPLVGIIVGIIYFTKDDPDAKAFGKLCLILAGVAIVVCVVAWCAMLILGISVGRFQWGA